MIAHVVLFKPRATLAEQDREAFVAAFETALSNISLIRRARVGRRVTLGRLYDGLNPQDFPFAAILEFESESDLLAYLDHPAHRALGEQFYLTSDAAMVLDFDLIDADGVRALLA